MSLPRRQFLQYTAGSALGTVALGWLSACSAADPAATGGEGTPTAQGTAPGTAALDEAGNPLQVSALLAAATPGDRPLANGLGDPVFLVITDGPSLADYGLSAICPHRGCVVNWDGPGQRFVCPCHNSQFNPEGERTQGPATTGLSRVTVATAGEDILLAP